MMFGLQGFNLVSLNLNEFSSNKYVMVSEDLEYSTQVTLTSFMVRLRVVISSEPIIHILQKCLLLKVMHILNNMKAEWTSLFSQN